MEKAPIGLSEPLRRARSICKLPEEPVVTLPVRCENDVFSIIAPDRKLVLSTKREAAWCRAARHVVNPYDLILAVVSFYDQLFTVGREPWMHVRSSRERQWLHLAVEIGKSKRRSRGGVCGGARNVDEYAIG